VQQSAISNQQSAISNQMTRRRVVVTGIGVINPMGNDVETMWGEMKQSRSGVGYTTVFDASNFPTRISAEIKNWDITQAGEDAEVWKHRGRHTKFAAGAAKQAVLGSGVLDAIKDPTRFGVYLGSGEGDQDFYAFARMMMSAIDGDKLDVSKFVQTGLETLNPLIEIEQEPNMPVAYLAGMFNAQGPNANCLTACAASSQAIGEATELIRRGDVDVMLSSGAHSMTHPFVVTGFNLLTALSTSNDQPTKASRPFDRLRDGFVLGEGAAMIVLEELEHAKRRGAQIYGEVLGYGTTADAYRITDIHPQGRCHRLHADGHSRRRHRPRAGAVRQRSRYQHRRQRPRGNAGLQGSFWRKGHADACLQHQEHDGTPDRRCRSNGDHRLPTCHSRQCPPADDQLREP